LRIRINHNKRPRCLWCVRDRPRQSCR
jgi:hypothetical protein